MNTVVMIILAALLFLSLAPTVLIWSLTALISKKRYSLPYFKMTGICFFLSVITGAIMNLELEGGAGSAFFFIAVLSVLWSLALLPFIYIFKVRRNPIVSEKVEKTDAIIISNRLILLTSIITILGIASTIDDDLSAITLFCAGFIYSLVLIFSLKSTPEKNKIAGVVLLGGANYITFFLALPVSSLPKIFESFFLVLPSVAGVVVTFLTITRLWGIKLSTRDLKTLLVYVLIGTLSFSFVMLGLQYAPIKLNVFSMAINSVIWWVCFTAALLTINSRANKSINYAPLAPDVQRARAGY
tara:strand:+ start:67 stop:963 length:897 start_codon:yes stop_codon:yes gene_type:complete